MSNVLVDKTKLDYLANAISNKSGEALTLTLDEMVEAVDGIEVSGGGITPTGNIDITQAGVTDVTNYATATVPQGEVVAGSVHGFTTQSGVKKWYYTPKASVDEQYDIGTAGYIANETEVWGDTEYFNAIEKNTSVTPTESAQTIGGNNTMMEGAVTVNAIPTNYVGSGIAQRSSSDLTASGATVTAPSGYYSSNATKTIASGTEGTPTATKGAVSNHSVSVTPSVTNSAGYISGGTKTGTAVSVTARELVSGNLPITANANSIDVAEYSTVSVNVASSSDFETATVTMVNVGDDGAVWETSVIENGELIHSVAVPYDGVSGTDYEVVLYDGENVSVLNNYAVFDVQGNATYSNGTLTITGDCIIVYEGAVTGPSGTLTITENGTYNVTNYASAEVSVGGSGVSVGTAVVTGAYSSSLSITNLAGEPKSFYLMSLKNLSVPSSGQSAVVVSVASDGTSVNASANILTNASQVNAGYVESHYLDNTLFLSSSGANFNDDDYVFIYSYGGTAANVDTKEVQVGSGATSITFTGLEDEPEYFSLVFSSSFGTSSGYQRVITLGSYNGDIVGMEFDSSAKFSDAHWSYTYNNGTLTITSQGTNAGGYFHQPGYYKLTYAISGDQSLQTKTVTPTESTQNVTADTAQGYTALKKVVVNPIPSSYVQPTATKGATTYTPTTSNQTIASGTYLTGTQTISGDANLVAGNIKSGTTIFGVTGTYTGGGGGSVQYDTKTVTASDYPTSLSFSSMKGQPKFFAVRLNAQVSSSGSTTYYYIVDIVSNCNGSSVTTHGNCFRIGSTRRIDNITSGYSWSYSGTTLTITSSAASRSASPGAFYSGSYELLYAY